MSNEGCVLKTESKAISITSVPVGGIAVIKPNQCLVGNAFAFTNTSTNAVGRVSYTWNLGDGTTDTTINIFHKYTTPGVYTVKLNSQQ